MKKYLAVLICIAVGMLLASSAMAYTGSYTPGVGINGTPHDLGTAANGMDYTAVPADSLTRICIFCHAPHNAYKLSLANGGPGTGVGAGTEAPDEYTYLPLWNHTLEDPIPAFEMYYAGPDAPLSGPKATQAIAEGMTIGSVSLLCLSCHDGNVAVNSYGNADQRPQSVSTGSTLISTSYVIGKDNYLGNHHPIGFNYNDVQAGDTEIRDASVVMMTPVTTVEDHLFNEKLECASCHSVHNKGNDGEVLLWRSDQNSELCLTCHDKGIYTAP